MIAILGGPSKGNRALLRGLRGLGHEVSLLRPRAARARLGAGDIALGRLDVRPTLDGIEEGLLELLWLERSGVRVVNTAAALVAAHDKWRAWRLLDRSGAAQPWTAHVSSERELRGLEPPFVVKPRFGSWGRDVMRCRDRAELEGHLVALRERSWFRRQGAIVQELLPPAGRDLRLLVAGGEIVGAVERIAAPGEWRTNVSLGGSSRPAAPEHEARALAIEAAAAIGAELVGVDLLPSRDEWVVLELNGAADFDERYSLEGREIFADLADALALGPVRGAHVLVGRSHR